MMTYKTIHSLSQPLHTCQISLHRIFQLRHYPLKIQGSLRFPGLRRSQLAAGLFPVGLPSSGITSQLKSYNLALLTPKPKLKTHFFELAFNQPLISTESFFSGSVSVSMSSYSIRFYIVLLMRVSLFILINITFL